MTGRPGTSPASYAGILADVFLPEMAPADWLAAIRGVAPDTPLKSLAE